MSPISFQVAGQLADTAHGAFSFVTPDSLFGGLQRTTVQFHYSRGTLRQQPEYVAPYSFYGFAGR